MSKRSCLLTIILLVLSYDCMADQINALSPMAKKLLKGRTVTIDPGFPSYKGRSARSIAEEIVANGYSGVYYFVTSDNAIRSDIIKELKNKDVPVGFLIIASGAYLPLDERPTGWEKWKMEFTNNSMDSYSFMSFVHKEYAEWSKQRVVNLIKKYDFDGVTFAEAMYPITNGLECDNVFYGDISPEFQKLFKEATGNTVFPEFIDKDSPNYYKKITDVYNDLVDFRVKTVNDFYDEIINGEGGVRQQCPSVMVATWTLGINQKDGVEKLREWEGNDIPSMIKQVEPDLHFVQTHYPDWANPDLKPSYVRKYYPFIKAVRDTDENMPIGFQADFVSHKTNRRDPNWQKCFYRTCDELAIDSTTYYVFSLRWDVYEEAPELVSVKKSDSCSLELCFDQRIAKSCQDIISGREMIIDEQGIKYKVEKAEVDGNLLHITLDKQLQVDQKITVLLEGIKDDPSCRYTSDTIPLGEENVIAEGVKKTFILR